MTCLRDPDSWCGRIWAIAKGLGEGAAGQACGVTPSRLRQLANPNRNDANVIETLLRLDLASARAGLGTPLFDLWADRLVAGGGLRENRAARRNRLLEGAVHGAARALRMIIETLESALVPAPQMQRVRA